MSLDNRNYSTLTPFCSFRQDNDCLNSFFLENQNQPYCNSKIYELFPDDNSQKQHNFSIINCNGDQSNQIEEEIPKIKQKKVKIVKIKKIQDPHRNILTNIGNQILNFISIKRKSNDIIKSYFSDFSVQEEENYYIFASKIKKSINGYINQSKLKKIWQPTNLSKDQARYQSIVRRLSLYYLQNRIIETILTSKKLNKNIIEAHFNVRRDLLQTLLDVKN